MHQISVEAVFSAAHAIAIRGEREPVHGHDWRVTATYEGETLDADGLLCDFHVIERDLKAIASEWNNRNLNECRPFSPGGGSVNPTAENVARAIADRLPRRVEGARLTSVRVTEAPGCAATYSPRLEKTGEPNRSERLP